MKDAFPGEGEYEEEEEEPLRDELLVVIAQEK